MSSKDWAGYKKNYLPNQFFRINFYEVAKLGSKTSSNSVRFHDYKVYKAKQLIYTHAMTYGEVLCTWVDVHLFFPKYNGSLQYARDKSECGFMMMA